MSLARKQESMMQSASSISSSDQGSSLPWPSHILGELDRLGRRLHIKAGSRLAAQPASAEERYLFVIEGHLAVVVDAVLPGTGGVSASGASTPPRARTDAVVEYLTYFEPGDFFSDAYLADATRDRGAKVECMAQTKTVLAAIPEPMLRAWMSRDPSSQAFLRERITALRLHFLKHRLPERRLVQDFFLRNHYANAKTVRVSALDACIACNACVQACSVRHGGMARLSRTGNRLGRVLFPATCPTCEDARCISVCRANALQRGPSGEIIVDERCNACGACSKVCPREAISVQERAYAVSDFPHPIPEADADGATRVDGIYVIGDLAVGRKMTSLASRAGVQAIHRAASRAPLSPLFAHALTIPDVIVVGAGPAALSVVQECKSRNLRCTVVEMNRISSAKDDPTGLGALWAKIGSSGACTVYEEERAVQIVSDAAGYFAVHTTRRVHSARNVVIATGAGSDLAWLEQAGIPILQPGSPEMARHVASLGARRQAVKCDGCAGYEDEACMTACPTGALVEIAPTELFFGASAKPSRPLERPDFSADPFLEGVSEHRADRGGGFLWLGSATLIVSTGVGVECFLRRTMPESSLTDRLARLRGIHQTTDFVSSRDLGHWLGYVGTGLMLATLLYSLRSRLNWFSRISKQTFLSLHIWMGVAGAAFVSYHSLLKLDRWVAIAMWAMWFVILTGTVGRYVYGWVHSQIGLTDVELKAFEFQKQQLGSLWGNGSMSGGAAFSVMWPYPDDATEPAAIGLLSGFFKMVWYDLRDRARLLRLRFFGMKHLSSRRLRRQMIRHFAERAGAARRKRYWEQAQRLLAWWNGIHIAVALAVLAISAVHIVYSIIYTGW